jgi:hypothetical protein
MTRMAQERDSILRIRAKVDSHDELEESKIGTEEHKEKSEASNDRIRFCSVEKPLRVRNLVDVISHEVPIKNLTSKLAKFLRAATHENITEQRLNVCSVCSIPIFCREKCSQTWRSLDPSFSICTSDICMPHECCTQVRLSTSHTEMEETRQAI